MTDLRMEDCDAVERLAPMTPLALVTNPTAIERLARLIAEDHGMSDTAAVSGDWQIGGNISAMELARAATAAVHELGDALAAHSMLVANFENEEAFCVAIANAIAGVLMGKA